MSDNLILSGLRYLVALVTIGIRVIAVVVLIDIAAIPREWITLVLVILLWAIAVVIDWLLGVRRESGLPYFVFGFCSLEMVEDAISFFSHISRNPTVAVSENSVRIAFFLASWLIIVEYVIWGLWTKKIRVNF